MTIDEAVELIIDHRGRTPKKLGGDFASDGVQVVSAKHVYGGRLHLDENQRFVEPEMAERWMPRKLAAGDVLLTSEAPLGEVAYLTRSGELCLGQRLFALRARQDITDSRFLYFLLCSPLVQRRLHARATGTTAQGIKQSELRQLELELPSIEVQRRVGSLLATLDDKIDSNHRMEALLEQMAATTFRGQFVDFVGHEKLKVSEIGPIPSGWGLGTVADLVNVVKDGVHPAEASDELFEHFSIPAFDQGREPELAPGGTMLSAKTRLPDGDCILMSKLNPQRSWRIWWPRPSGARQAVCSPEFVVLTSREPVATSYLFALLSCDDRLRSRIIGHVSGTTGSRQRVKPREILESPVLIPDSAAMRGWDVFARPLYEHAQRLHVESRSLASVRDMLLPKLVSGETQVPDAADPDEAIGTATKEVAA